MSDPLTPVQRAELEMAAANALVALVNNGLSDRIPEILKATVPGVIAVDERTILGSNASLAATVNALRELINSYSELQAKLGLAFQNISIATFNAQSAASAIREATLS